MKRGRPRKWRPAPRSPTEAEVQATLEAWAAESRAQHEAEDAREKATLEAWAQQWRDEQEQAQWARERCATAQTAQQPVPPDWDEPP